MMKQRKGDRRQIERRTPKQGVNIRHDDNNYLPKRVKRMQWNKENKMEEEMVEASYWITDYGVNSYLMPGTTANTFVQPVPPSSEATKPIPKSLYDEWKQELDDKRIEWKEFNARIESYDSPE